MTLSLGKVDVGVWLVLLVRMGVVGVAGPPWEGGCGVGVALGRRRDDALTKREVCVTPCGN